MSVPARLALFAVLVAAVFGAAAALGGAVDPEGADEDASAHAQPEEQPAHEEEPGGHAKPATAAAGLPGLAAEQDGLRLELADPRRERGDASAPVRFRIVDDRGEAVRDFDVEHEKRMHLIVVRRDLTGFQHLHPRMAQDGTWETTADLSDSGTHRVYADFSTGGEKRTLGTDLHVAGAYEPRPLARPATVASAGDGVEVRLHRDGGHVSFDVLRDGRPVDDELEPYLGAKGHLVALRAADLAYLHTHPEGDQLAFDTDLPSSGTYRLWVQFQLDGRVRTAGFTIEVDR